MKYTDKIFYGLLSLLVFISCQPDDPGNKKPPVSGSNKTNEWIESVMRQYYLWNEEIPDELDYSLDPEMFFESMLSLQDGKPRGTTFAHRYYSYIEKKTTDTKAIGDDDDMYGFDFTLYTLVDNNNNPTGEAMARILYVLPSSPASEAGLQRDDWITAINGKKLTSSMYMSLINGSSISLTVAKRRQDDRQMVSERTVKLPASRKVDNNPLLHHSVLTKGSKKIGYLVYNHFSSGPGDDNKDQSYDDRMRQIFAEFKSQQVNEFVLDLRYNGGGLVTCAQLITTMLAPANALGDVFCHMIDNQKRKSTYLLDKNIIKNGANLDLKRLYVLVTNSTASASEAVINCLIPYMGRENITLIGMQTEGKTVGSNTFGRDEDYDWILHPITVHIYNKDGHADYADGFTPDIPFNELDGMEGFVELKELGDENDPALAIALGQITGTPRSSFHSAPATKSGSGLIPVYSSLQHRRGGLIVPKEK